MNLLFYFFFQCIYFIFGFFTSMRNAVSLFCNVGSALSRTNSCFPAAGGKFYYIEIL